MEIARETADTLRRYFLNASPFLWGVLEARKKKERIIEIKGMGFLENYSEKSKNKYDTINQELLVELGIEGIIGVEEIFGTENFEITPTGIAEGIFRKGGMVDRGEAIGVLGNHDLEFLAVM